MSKHFCFLLLFACSLFSYSGTWAQTSGHSIWVSGQVLREDTKAPIAGVSVFQKSTGEGMATNEQGAFRVKIPASDTLVFRALGYRQKEYVPSLRSVTELRIVLLLQEESVQLKEVRVSPISPEKVDRVLRNMKPRPAPPKPRMNVTVPRIIIPPGPPTPPDIFSSPISFLWEQFSKEGKQRSRVAKLMEERERQKELERLLMRQDSIRQARLRYNRFFRDTTSFYDPRW